MLRQSEKGQAVILVVVASGLFMIGALGLAVDGAQLYAHRQMAQNAADAAAQAGMMSIFSGTWTSPAAHTCTTTDTLTPCVYARNDGFGAVASDVVALDIPTDASVPGVNFASDPVHLLRVTITRPVTTGIMRLLGASSSTSIKAIGVAAIVDVVAPVPIIVTHPTKSGAFSASGTGATPKIQICGGPSRSVQVNSSSGSSLTANGNPIVDLAHAGPADPGDCTTGTGSDFGDFGGPSASSIPFILQSGTTGTYIQPAAPILDPLAGVSAPPVPAAAPASTALGNGLNGCPASPAKPCILYSPGMYTTKIQSKNETSVFKPGIYYMNGVDFSTAANGYMTMATGFTDAGAGTTATGWTGNILVYMTGPGTPPATGSISVGANGSVTLVGSPAASAYKSILFFVNRTAAAQSHTLDGGGGLSLTGTIYITNTLDIMNTTPSQYQTLSMQGNAGSSTHIVGEIIASVLSLGGTPGIVMNLNPAATLHIRQVALVH